MDFNSANGIKGFNTFNTSMFIGGFFLKAVIWWIIILFIFTAILKWLWNITIPSIFGIREITFWESFRLILIAGILFGKGFGFNMNF